MTEPRSPSRDFPANGWYPETQKPPRSVNVAANLLCINGGLALLNGFYALALLSLSPIGLLIALALLAIAAIQLRAGVLVRQLVPWGRTAGILLSVLAVLLRVPIDQASMVGFVVALALGGATIWLLYRPATLRVFPTRGLLRL